MSEKLFFKHDYYALEDRSLRRLVAKHRALGYATFFVGLEFFYKENGAAIDRQELSYDIADKLHIESEYEVDEVIEECLKIGLFKYDQESGNEDMIYSDRVREACQELNSYKAQQKGLWSKRWKA